jgi:hypothetical protein
MRGLSMTKHRRIQARDRRQNNQGQWYEIIGRTGDRAYATRKPVYDIEFDSGYRTTATSQDMHRGKIRDKGAPSVCGVGITGWKIGNPAAHPLYGTWHGMIERCHSTDERYRHYHDVIVCQRWLRFDLFVEDAERLPGYDLECICQRELTLDKDRLGTHRGKPVYSADTCVWASHNEQAAFRRRLCPSKAPQCAYRGVHWTDNGFIARPQFRGEKRYLGYYQDPLEAARVIMEILPDYYLAREQARIKADSPKPRTIETSDGVIVALIGSNAA